jgi:alpha-galactosidase
MRVSADVAPSWSPKRSWPGFEESAPAAVNAIQASVLRAPLHRRLWLNDPDCLLLRPAGTELSAWQRRMLCDAVSGCGAYTVVSDDLSRYSPSEWAVVDELRAALPERDTVVGIDDVFAPAVTVRGRSWQLTADWAAPRIRLVPA